MKRKGQPMVRFPVHLPRELWDVLKNDRELGKTRVFLDWEPTMNNFIRSLVIDWILAWRRRNYDPANFEPSKYPFLPGKRIQIAVRLPTDVYVDFRKFCAEAGTSMNETVIEWLFRDKAVQAALKRHRYIN